MTSPHFLLQDWSQWAQGLVALWQGGGWQYLRDASGNYNAGRDLVNGADGTGAVLTGEAFKRLTGFSAPKEEARDGSDRIHQVVGGWINDIFGGSDGGPQPGPGSRSPDPQPAPPEHFPLEGFVPDSPGGQGAPPSSDATLQDLLPDDLKSDGSVSNGSQVNP